jgi:hypothetical protein
MHARERRARGTASPLPCHEGYGRADSDSKTPEFVERVERLEAERGLDPRRQDSGDGRRDRHRRERRLGDGQRP